MRSWQIVSQSGKPLSFVKSECSGRCSPHSITCVYPALDNRITQPYILLQIHFDITFPYILKSLRQHCMLHSSIPTKTLYALLFFLCLIPLPYCPPEFNNRRNFYVLLTVHLSIFILVINQLGAQNFLFYNKFISCLYMFRAPCAHHQEVKIVLYNCIIQLYYTRRCIIQF
jgi:hypothetical protein